MADFAKDSVPEGQVRLSLMKFEGARCSLCFTEQEKIITITGSRNKVNICPDCLEQAHSFARVI